jgi:1,4-dihydroxy-2-naphthoate octaprenyltransferase
MALAVVNAIPDFHQDRLVGKRNLVVRLGRQRAVWLYLALACAGFGVIIAGVAAQAFPPWTLVALAGIPFVVASGRCAIHAHSTPRQFRPAMQAMVLAYLVVTGLFAAAILGHAIPR